LNSVFHASLPIPSVAATLASARNAACDHFSSEAPPLFAQLLRRFEQLQPDWIEREYGICFVPIRLVIGDSFYGRQRHGFTYDAMLYGPLESFHSSLSEGQPIAD
jgi:hypothetical protein